MCNVLCPWQWESWLYLATIYPGDCDRLSFVFGCPLGGLKQTGTKEQADLLSSLNTGSSPDSKHPYTIHKHSTEGRTQVVSVHIG